jgi:transcriptional regulator with XRE-family HTH domain
MLTPLVLGNKIRQLRIAAGKSQEQLGAALDRTHATISDIERGVTNLNVTDLAKIADFFNVPVNEILKDETQSFEPVTHNRDAKDMTEDEKNLADKITQEVIKHYRDLLKKD